MTSQDPKAMKMTKADFVKVFAEMMRENYPSVTNDFVAKELDSQLKGEKPQGIIGMFMADNLKKIEITDR